MNKLDSDLTPFQTDGPFSLLQLLCLKCCGTDLLNYRTLHHSAFLKMCVSYSPFSSMQKHMSQFEICHYCAALLCNCLGCFVSRPLSMKWVVLRAPELAKPASVQIHVLWLVVNSQWGFFPSYWDVWVVSCSLVGFLWCLTICKACCRACLAFPQDAHRPFLSECFLTFTKLAEM